jgi:undecaprenyl-diphosphatase
MNILSSILLGIIQGLTEFLPVSSSGHLVIVQQILPNFDQPGILFDVVLHAGTLLAVVVYYWRRLLKIDTRYLSLLIIGTVPSFIAGTFFYGIFEEMFTSIKLVGYMLIITGTLNYLTDIKISRKHGSGQGPSLSIMVGLAQAFAIVPGISRSGSTIFAGIKLGLKKKEAAEFSFLLSIPAILGANILEMIKLGSIGDINITNYFIGFLSAFVVGYLSIKLVLKALVKSQFKYFAVYCLILGAAIIVFY